MVELRTIDADGWAAWRAVRLRALAEAPAAFGSTLADWADAPEVRWRRRLDEVPLNLLAVDGSGAVGQASATAADAGGQVELLSMWVAPQARGAGVARRLIDAVCDWARGAGASEVRLSVRRTNQSAIACYEATGFRVSTDPGDEPGEMAMVRSLQP